MQSKSESHRLPGQHTLDTRHGPLVLGGRSLIMGILNVTPDSFSDGGQYLDAKKAIDQGIRLATDGADIIDIGGESTRPGSQGVEAAEQIRRVVPVIRGLRTAGLALPVSIDTQSALVAQAALDAGADFVNDVSAARQDPSMPDLLRIEAVPFVCMHMQGTPSTMQQSPTYEHVVDEVLAFFDERATALSAMGVDCSKMIIDPGIGFGKAVDHNLELLREVRRFHHRGRAFTSAGWPILVGPSRKAFIRKTIRPSGDSGSSPEAPELIAGTAAVALHCVLGGVQIIRVHDVPAIRALVAAGRTPTDSPD